MAFYPVQVFTKDNVLLRTGRPGQSEDYSSKPIAEKFAGPPKGVYTGFVPSAVGGVLTLSPDPTEGFSLIKLHSSGDPGGLDLIVSTPVTLDFATALPSDFAPNGVQVYAVASYVAGQPTTAQILARPRQNPPQDSALDEVLICELDAASTPSAINILAVPEVNRDTPLAFADEDFGFMPNGSMEELAAAVAILNEIVAARIDLQGGAVAVTAGSSTVTGTGTKFTTYSAGDVIQFQSQFLTNYTIATIEDDVSMTLSANYTGQTAPATTIIHPSLKSRLDYDLGGEAMASRLGAITCLLTSNDYAMSGGTSSHTVSGSLATYTRKAAPAITLDGHGDENTVGAVAEPNDVVRNICFIIDAVSGNRLIADATSREIVFGRLSKTTDFVLDGTLTFSTSLVTLTGVGTKFTVQAAVGDTVQGPDGNFYEIASIASDTSALLVSAYQSGTAGSTQSSGGLLRRRFTLALRKFESGMEVDHTLTAPTIIRFFFPAFLSAAHASFNATDFMHSPGERPIIPDATTSTHGKVALANASSPYVGSMNLKQKGVPVAGGPFHTLNFNGVPGGLSSLGSGIITVTQIGPQGPDGPDPGSPPSGNPGAVGPSLNKIATFQYGNAGPYPVAGVKATFTYNFGFTITFLSGGIAAWQQSGGNSFNLPHDFVEISDLSLPDTTHGQIETSGGLVGSTTQVQLYLDACGYA